MKEPIFFSTNIFFVVLFALVGVISVYYFILHQLHSTALNYQKFYFMSVAFFAFTSAAHFIVQVTNENTNKKFWYQVLLAINYGFFVAGFSLLIFPIAKIYFLIHYSVDDFDGNSVKRKKNLLRITMGLYILVTTILFAVFADNLYTIRFRIIETVAYISPVILIFYFSYKINQQFQLDKDNNFYKDYHKMFIIICTCVLLQLLTIPFFIGYTIRFKKMNEIEKCSIFFGLHILDIITICLLIKYIFITPKKENKKFAKKIKVPLISDSFSEED
ncbi:hypothetical protein M0813_01096 [Anaeramoeba flamelloides]|uniref:Uncharacterized protein n=1 Tax=Anaeramoeba flamelloides TaxID=1746091 RepID=A0ABQ8X2A8_9EUKA|nr:hypothetical protein M0813_01096 [Anaeramoeba flamelloides]